MEAKELRIGNLFKTTISRDRGEAKVVYGVKGNTVYVDEKYCYDITHVKPIPLTEEWLLKFGFVSGIRYWYHENLNLIKGRTINGEDIIMSPNNKYVFKVKYVHQLQNLAYGLTGKELELCKQS